MCIYVLYVWPRFRFFNIPRVNGDDEFLCIHVLMLSTYECGHLLMLSTYKYRYRHLLMASFCVYGHVMMLSTYECGHLLMLSTYKYGHLLMASFCVYGHVLMLEYYKYGDLLMASLCVYDHVLMLSTYDCGHLLLNTCGRPRGSLAFVPERCTEAGNFVCWKTFLRLSVCRRNLIDNKNHTFRCIW